MAGTGLSKPYYAIYNAEGNVVTYSGGGLMGMAVSTEYNISVSEDNNLYADNKIAESDRRFAGGTVSLTTDDLSQEVSKAILGLKEVELGDIPGITDEGVKELIYDDDQATPYLGMGEVFQKIVRGVTKYRAVVLKKVMFSVPSEAATTQGETIEWQTPTISGTILRDDTDRHAWKSEATFSTEAQAEIYIKHRLGIA